MKKPNVKIDAAKGLSLLSIALGVIGMIVDSKANEANEANLKKEILEELLKELKSN